MTLLIEEDLTFVQISFLVGEMSKFLLFGGILVSSPGHKINLGTDLLTKSKASSFFCPPHRHLKTYEVPLGTQKALRIPICYTCLTLTLMLI